VIAVPHDSTFRVEETTGQAVAAVGESLDRLQKRIDHATTTMDRAGSTRGLTLRETVGVAMLKEDRRITRLHVDAAWWEQGLKAPLERAGLYLGQSGVSIPFTMPDPDRTRLLAARQGAVDRLERLMLGDKLPVSDGLRWMIDMGALPEPPEGVDIETAGTRILDG